VGVWAEEKVMKTLNHHTSKKLNLEVFAISKVESLINTVEKLNEDFAIPLSFSI